MMYDDLKSQEMIERKIKNAPAGQGTVRMLTCEEWESVQDVRPRTPFESTLASSNARLRTGEPLKMEDVKDWTIDVLTDAQTRAEECAKRGSTSFYIYNSGKLVQSQLLLMYQKGSSTIDARFNIPSFY